MTSNIGARFITEHRNLGFGFSSGPQEDEKREYENNKTEVLNELKKNFRPEFLNRVDDIIVFHKLTQQDIEKIASHMLEQLAERMETLEMHLSFSPEAVSEISKIGFDPVYGARPLRRAITARIEDMIAEQMLEGKIKAGDSIQLRVQDGTFLLDKEVPQTAVEAMTQ